MKLNKRLWALVDPTDDCIMWDHERPFINETKRELTERVSLYRKSHPDWVKRCKIKQIIISYYENV